jgi:AraC-like DNA-binding protein
MPYKRNLPESGLRKKVWGELEKEKNSIYCHTTISDEVFVPLHKHTNRGQLIYSEGGKVYITDGNKVWYLPARHYMWIPAGMQHSVKLSMPSVLLWIIYFPLWKNELSFFKKPGVYPVNDLLLELIYFTRNWKGHITKRDETKFFFASGIKALLPEISKHGLPFNLPTPKDPKLEKVIRYLHDNLSEHLLIKDVAKKFEISERTLARLFRKDLKMTFINYLTILRIIHSVELLALGNLTIKEICFEVGYESVPTFSNVFKKALGVRPTEYINKK